MPDAGEAILPAAAHRNASLIECGGENGRWAGVVDLCQLADVTDEEDGVEGAAEGGKGAAAATAANQSEGGPGDRSHGTPSTRASETSGGGGAPGQVTASLSHTSSGGGSTARKEGEGSDSKSGIRKFRGISSLESKNVSFGESVGPGNAAPREGGPVFALSRLLRVKSGGPTP